MKILTQNKNRIYEVNEFILITIGEDKDKIYKIRDAESSIDLAVYYNRDIAYKVLKDIFDLTKKIYKVTNFKELCNEKEILEVCNNICYEFPE